MSRILYHYWRSSCSWRVRWALEIKGLSYTPEVVNLLSADQRSDAYLAKNPMGQVPFFQDENGVGLADSMVIMEYLEEVYPTPALLPGNAAERAHIRRLCHIVASGTQPIQNLAVMRAAADTPEGQKAWNRRWIGNGLAAFESALGEGSGLYCVGDSLTLADICLIPQVYNANRVGLDMSAYPKVAAIYDRCRALDSCKRAEPEAFDPNT